MLDLSHNKELCASFKLQYLSATPPGSKYPITGGCISTSETNDGPWIVKPKLPFISLSVEILFKDNVSS